MRLVMRLTRPWRARACALKVGPRDEHGRHFNLTRTEVFRRWRRREQTVCSSCAAFLWRKSHVAARATVSRAQIRDEGPSAARCARSAMAWLPGVLYFFLGLAFELRRLLSPRVERLRVIANSTRLGDHVLVRRTASAASVWIARSGRHVREDHGAGDHFLIGAVVSRSAAYNFCSGADDEGPFFSDAAWFS